MRSLLFAILALSVSSAQAQLPQITCAELNQKGTLPIAPDFGGRWKSTDGLNGWVMIDGVDQSTFKMTYGFHSSNGKRVRQTFTVTNRCGLSENSSTIIHQSGKIELEKNGTFTFVLCTPNKVTIYYCGKSGQVETAVSLERKANGPVEFMVDGGSGNIFEFFEKSDFPELLQTNPHRYQSVIVLE